jgi:hypothetical protein
MTWQQLGVHLVGRSFLIPYPIGCQRYFACPVDLLSSHPHVVNPRHHQEPGLLPPMSLRRCCCRTPWVDMPCPLR